MDVVGTVRRFNRSYTRQIGVLDESYLGSGRPLGPSRVLFELGAGPVGVVELRRRLGFDSGYLSRLLRRIEADGLAVVGRDPTDGRRRVVTLTPAGRREWRSLDRRSDAAAAALVKHLSPRRRDELAQALERAERLLCVAAVTVDEVDPSSDEAQSAMAAYFAELDERFVGGFDPGAGGADHDARTMRPPDGRFVVLRADDGSVVGCGGLLRHDAATGEIKRMWIHPEWRGLGLGARLLAELEGLAAGLGRSRVVLDTNAVLTEAVEMYERSGYRATVRYNDNPYAHHWFEKQLAAG